jgi:hypothetical protein
MLVEIVPILIKGSMPTATTKQNVNPAVYFVYSRVKIAISTDIFLCFERSIKSLPASPCSQQTGSAVRELSAVENTTAAARRAAIFFSVKRIHNSQVLWQN